MVKASARFAKLFSLLAIQCRLGTFGQDVTAMGISPRSEADEDQRPTSYVSWPGGRTCRLLIYPIL
jgi:hypothetical protein